MHEYCERGDTRIVNMLLCSPNLCDGVLESLDERGRTPLAVACKQNHEEIVILLVQAGSAINYGDFAGNRPLHLTTQKEVCLFLCVCVACVHGCMTACMSVFLPFFFAFLQHQKQNKIKKIKNLKNKKKVARWLVAYGGRLDVPNLNNICAREGWKLKLDAYFDVYNSLRGEDASVQESRLNQAGWFDDSLV